MPGRQVALKLLAGGRRASPDERRQWLREARAASLVRHPHVVTLYEVAETERWFLLALEYVPGGTLADRLSGPIAPISAARLTQTIARAVHHIHRSGLLHLDLKPSNVLLDGEADAAWDAIIPKVSDFGIARSCQPGTTDTGPADPGGTPSYMAPEQISGSRKDMTAQADIHGLGAILYHMLTGRPPYLGATVLETIDQLHRQDPVPPRRMSPGIPRDLESICMKCLNKDPGRRYPSADALADDLGRWLDGRPISARPVSAVERAWRWCRRRPAIAAMASVLVLTVSIGFVSAIVLWRRAEASYRIATEIVGDLAELLAGGEDNRPRSMDPEDLIPILEMHRKRLLTLAASRPDDLLVGRYLVRTARHLSLSLMQANRYEEARIVLLENLGRTEELIRRHPSDITLRTNMRGYYLVLAETCEAPGQFRRCYQVSQSYY